MIFLIMISDKIIILKKLTSGFGKISSTAETLTSAIITTQNKKNSFIFFVVNSLYKHSGFQYEMIRC